MAELLSRVRDMDLWELFHSMFTFLCMLLDSKMAREAGEQVTQYINTHLQVADTVLCEEVILLSFYFVGTILECPLSEVYYTYVHAVHVCDCMCLFH